MPRPLGSKNKKPSGKAQNSRKRASPPVNTPEPKRTRTQESSKTQYCWICNSTLQNGETGYSKTCCRRVYHTRCLKGNKSDLNQDTCPECQLKSVDGTLPSKPIPPNKLQLLLLAIMSRRKKEDSFKNHRIFDHWPRNAEDDIVNIIDFQTLDKKIKGSAYSKASQFFSDTKWILHNSFIIYGSISEVTSAAKQLLKSFKADLLDMEACYKCFENGIFPKENSFIEICKPPHVILWVKMKGWPFWPAKLLKINNESVYVKFFKTHDIGKDIPFSWCYFISNQHPNGSGSIPQKVKPAFNEFKNYVLNYEKKYGANSFKLKDVATAFTPSKISEEILQEEAQNSSTSPNSATDSMKNSVEPPAFTESTDRCFRGTDIGPFITTKVITSTPIVATPSDISSEDVTLGADLNSMSGSSDFSFPSASPHSRGSARASPSSPSFNTASTSHSFLDIPGPSTSSNSYDLDCYQSIVPILENMVRNELPFALGPYTQHLASFEVDGESITSLFVSFVTMCWSLVHGLPDARQVVSHAYKGMIQAQRISESLKKENNDLKLRVSDLQSVISKLHFELLETQKKNKELNQEFQDATKNARTVIHSLKQEAMRVLHSKLEDQKKEYEQKLKERDSLIEECEKQLNVLKDDSYAAQFKNLRTETSNEQPSEDNTKDQQEKLNSPSGGEFFFEKSIPRNTGGLFYSFHV